MRTRVETKAHVYFIALFFFFFFPFGRWIAHATAMNRVWSVLVQFILLDPKSACMNIWSWNNYCGTLLISCLLVFFCTFFRHVVHSSIFSPSKAATRRGGTRKDWLKPPGFLASLFIFCSGGGRRSTGMRLDVDHREWTQIQQTLLLFTHTHTYTHMGWCTLQHWAMCVSS